ncbi:MAG: hypothetical protein EBS01_00755 [Verrucomicrobia bacterium]|nr:hypothetical protein [Verrucomicrobiota bacterium]
MVLLMKNSAQEQVKEHYQRLRKLDCEALWEEVAWFDSAEPAQRVRLVSVVRAVGVVFLESGTPSQREKARKWLRGLLADPEEKVRRYAMVALSKLGGGEAEELQLLSLVDKAAGERENRFLVQTLERIGGNATLKAGEAGSGKLARVVQKVRANVARREGCGAVAFDKTLRSTTGVRVGLECRAGLESVVAGELSEQASLQGKLKVDRMTPGLVALQIIQPFALRELYALRCFSGVVFALGELPPLTHRAAPLPTDALASIITSKAALCVLQSFTSGPIRYRLEFASRKPAPSAVRDLTERVFAKAPELLNDPRAALWEIMIRESAAGISVELRPRLRPDPRFDYRQGDVPAASHPPLAAAMARIAQVGQTGGERIWDPFCGSGLELAECVLMGGVESVFGTDLSSAAVAVADANVAAASGRRREEVRASRDFVASDFRAALDRRELRDLTLIITNPPLGKRVPVEDLRQMVHGLFEAAKRLLRPGGRLVFVNPLNLGPSGYGLRLESGRSVDLGFAHFQLEKYVKEGATRGALPSRPSRAQRIPLKASKASKGGEVLRVKKSPER